MQELQQKLSDQVMIRRLKENVLTQLPPKQRQKIAFPLKESKLKEVSFRAWQMIDINHSMVSETCLFVQ